MLILYFRAIKALVYNVLKSFMDMDLHLFEKLATSYKSERQK